MLGKDDRISGRDERKGSRSVLPLAVISLCVLCLCVACVLAFEPSNGDATEFSDSNFNYTVTSETEHTVEISGLVDESKTSMPAIPATVVHEGVTYKVTAIGDYAFYLLEDLKGTVTIPKDIVSIGWKSFEGAGITGLSFAADSELTTIGYRAFNGCPITGTVTIPSKVTTIGDTAFYMVTMTGLEFSQSDVELTIEGSAFGKCTNLTTVTIPKNVKTIGDRVFSGCSNLASLTFTDNGSSKLESIGAFAFADCTSLTGNIQFPASLKSIGSSCFKGTAITGITFPVNSSFEEIGERAFFECASLDGTVAFPEKLTIIGPYAFHSSSISGITFAASSEGVSLDICNGAFEKCASLTGNIQFPASLKSIGNFTFTQSHITGIAFSGNGPETIGTYAFKDCTNLTGKLVILSGMKTIGLGAFANSALTSVDLSGATGLEVIEDTAFYGCKSMKIETLTIPASLTKISDGVFANGSKIDSIVFADSSKLSLIGEAAFMGCDIVGAITIPNSVTTIADMAFYDNPRLSTLSINNESKLTTIMDSAFSGCGLTGMVFIPKDLTNIGSQVFRNNTSELTFTVDENNKAYSNNDDFWLMDKNKTTVVCAPSAKNVISLTGITKVGDGAFADTAITGVTFDNSLTEIGNFAFDGCSGLDGDITFPASLKSIGVGAFTGTNIKSIAFAEKSALTSIGNNAFKGLDTLVCDLVIPAKVERIGEAAFSVTGISSLAFEEGSKLVVIGKNAFKNCKSLLTVQIPSSVTDIDDEAFSRCTYLMKVEFGKDSGIEFIGDMVFVGCNSLSWINFPSMAKVSSIGTDVFTHNGDKPGATLFRDDISSAGMVFNMENKDKFSGNVYSKNTLVVSDPLCRTCTVTLEYGFTEDEEVSVFAGALMGRPEFPETEYYVTTGWYWNGILWDFAADVVENNMTLVLSYSEIDEKGKAEIVAISGSAEIDFSNDALKTANVKFSEKTSIDIAKNGCSSVLTVSLFSKGDDKYQTIVQGPYSGTMTITLPYDSSKGTPDVYQYTDGGKVKMQCDVDKDGKTVTFKSAQPSSDDIDTTYGIEYTQESNLNTTLIAVAMIVVILAAIGVFYYTRKH